MDTVGACITKISVKGPRETVRGGKVPRVRSGAAPALPTFPLPKHPALAPESLSKDPSLEGLK